MTEELVRIWFGAVRDAADAGELEALYAARWPRRERLPVQTQILKQLQRQTHTAT